jgi:subtilisin family serine protease
MSKRRFHATALALVSILALASPGAVPAAGPGEYVVALRARPTTSAAAQGARFVERLRAMGAQPLATLAAGLPLARDDRRAPAVEGAMADPFGLDPERIWLVRATDPRALEALATDPDVDWLEPNVRREFQGWFEDSAPGAIEGAGGGATGLPGGSVLAGPGDPGFPSDPYFVATRQYGLWNAGPAGIYGGTAGADIHALEAWSLSVGSNDVILAIADTGIDPGHPELNATLLDGSPRLIHAYNATLDGDPSVADSFAHGTTVAGVMAARTNAGGVQDTIGVAGVCGGDGAANAGCRLVPIRVSERGSREAWSFDIARAMTYAASVGARAMNLSYAGPAPSRVERTAMYHALTHGCVVVVASGNRGTVAPTEPQYPAAYAADGYGLQVGASDWNDRRAPFSSYGPGLDLVAPGFSIWTTYMTYPSSAGVLRNGYAAASGTSYAAPHVAGAIGVLAAWRPELVENDFQILLRESADDIETPGIDPQTAYGRLNLAAALAAVPPSFGVWHDEVAAVVTDTLGEDSLVVGESGPGVMLRPRTWPRVQKLEIRAVVALPDSFVDSVRVWPRVGGTMSVRGDFRLPYFAPWAEVIDRTATGFTLRGYLYRALECLDCGDDIHVPLPPDQARFGFTVIGKVDRGGPAAPGGTAAATRGPKLRVTPNPSAAEARFVTDTPGQLTVMDAAGRVVARRDVTAGEWRWDGRDERGGATPPGLYFARLETAGVGGARSVAAVRFVRLAGVSLR